MRHPANLRRTVCAASAPLILSLLVHGLLLLVLWIWPTASHSAGGVVSSTRISLETCVLDIGSPSLLPSRPLPPDPPGPNVGTTMESRLLDAPPAFSETTLPVSDPSRPKSGGTGSPVGGGPSDDAHGGDGLFPLPATASSVVYVLDRSASMGMGDKLDRACRELIACLRRLPSSARFQIFCYNDYAMPLTINNRVGLLSAEPANIEAAARVLKSIAASGDTKHADALRRGLALRPDVLYLITDADNLPYKEIEAATRDNSVTAIHFVELTRRRAARTDDSLARLAHVNGGTYRRVPVSPAN